MKTIILALLVAASALAQSTVTTFRGPDGVERSYTLRDWPYRLYMTQAAYDNIKDPDGSGPLKNAQYDASEGQGLVYAINANRTSSDFVNNYPSTSNNPGQFAEYAALLYTMCNQCTVPWDAGTSWLQYAKTILLNHYAYSNKKYHGFYTYSDSASVAWGYNGSGASAVDADYTGQNPLSAALAYTLIRDQFTVGERTTIAKYFINGILPDDLCKLPVERQAGVVTKVGSTYTVTGNTWSGVSVNDLIVVNGYKDANGAVITTAQCQVGASCNWSWTGKVASIIDANTITLTVANGGSFPDFQEGYWFKYSAWDDSLCGYGRHGFSHGDFPPYLEAGSDEGGAIVLTSLPAITWPAPLGGETGINITVDKSNWSITNVPAPTPSNPWRAFIGGPWWDGEMVEITGISGTTLTITRGKWWHGKAWTCCTPGSPLRIRFVNILGRSYDPSKGLNNRQLTRSQSVIALSLAFCGDYAPACTVLRRAADYFQREGYAVGKDYVGLHNYSLGDYQFYRGIFASKIAAFLQNSTLSPSADWTGGGWIKNQGYLYSHWMIPWAPKEPIEVGQSKQFGCGQYGYDNAAECANGVGWLNLLFPDDPLTAYAWSFLKDSIGFNLHNGSVASVYGNGASGLSSNVMLTYLWLFAGGHSAWPEAADRTTLPLAYTQAHGDASQPGGTGYLTVASRSGWGTDSSIFWMAGIGSSDKLGSVPIATYGFGKKGWLLYGPYATGSSGRHQELTQFNTVLFGEATQTTFSNYTTCNYTNFPSGRCPERPLPAHATAKTSTVWGAFDDQYLFKKPTQPAAVSNYWLTNGGQANLHGLVHHWRNIFHFKLAGKRERLIVLDDVSKTVAEKIRVLNHYPQNGEVRDTLPNNGGRHYTEGSTRISADFTYVETQTGTGEGGVVRLVSSYLCAGDSTCDDFYDMPLEAVSASWPNTGVSVCPNASVSAPCSVKFGAYSNTFTSPIGSFTHQRSDAASANNNTNAKIWAYLDPADGIVKVGWTTQVSIVPSCDGSVSCVGVIASPPAGTLVLYWYRYAQSGGFSVGCKPTFVNGNEAWGTTTVGNCLLASRSSYSSTYTEAVDNTVPVSMQTNSTACNTDGCRIYTVHEVSEDTGITPSSKSEFSVTSGAGVFKGLAIGASSSDSAIAIFPIAQARATTLSFTNPSSTVTHAGISGLVEGTYRVRCSGVDHQTGISLAQGEAMLEVTNLPGSCVATVERTSGATLNVLATPSSVQKSCVFSGSNPSNQVVAISASGGTLTDISQSKVGSAAWLTVTPGSLSGVGNFTFAFNCAGLAVDTYTETVRFSSAQAEVTNVPYDVAVELSVTTPSSPVITATPATLSFSAIEGGSNPANQNVSVTVENGPATVSVSDNQSWCATSTSSFTGSSTATNVTVSLTTGALTAAGSPYSCTVTFSAAGATNKTTVVTFTITESPDIILNVGSLTNFKTTIGGNAPAPKTLTFSSQGGTLDNWSTSVSYASGSGWLSVPASGTTAGNLSISIVGASMPNSAGTHCATISIASTTANVTNSPVAVPVCIEMLSAPNIGITGTLTARVNVATTVGLDVTGGEGDYSWAISQGTLPSGLSFTSDTSASANISGTTIALGDYPLTLTVYDANGASATTSITLKVRPAPSASDIEVTPYVTAGGVLLHMRKQGLNANDIGKAVIRNIAGEMVTEKPIPAGGAVRVEAFESLPENTVLEYEVCYPTGVLSSPAPICARGTFTVDSATGESAGYHISITPPAGRGIVGLDVYMGTNQTQVATGVGITPTRLACVNPNPCVGTITNPKGLTYYRHVWRTVTDESRGDSGVKRVRVR